MSKIKFFGAARTVTGSRHYVEAEYGGRSIRFLFDCGLFQGKKKLREMNWSLEGILKMEPKFIFLSHAHIDHSGFLPRMVKSGYDRPIICTNTTRELTEILLADSAHIQEEDTKFAKKRGYSRHLEPLPLYDSEDAARANQLLKGIEYEEPFKVDDVFEFKFSNAGHIFGSAFIEFKVLRDDKPFKMLFTGDFGMQRDDDLAPSPTIKRDVDLLIMEGTYGDRLHGKEDTMDVLADSIDYIHKKGSTLIIPAFAVERTQNLLFYLYQLEQEGRLPKDVSLYVDSPLAIKATDIYNKKKRELSSFFRKFNQLYPERTVFTTTPSESKKINENPGPMILLSASGMLEGGRILHHLKYRLPYRDNLLLLSGFQAPGTRGDAIMNGEKEIKIHGKYFPVRCGVSQMSALSSHGDYKAMLEWLGEFDQIPPKIILVHGEEDSLTSFKAKIEERFDIKDKNRIIIPDMLEEYEFQL